MVEEVQNSLPSLPSIFSAIAFIHGREREDMEKEGRRGSQGGAEEGRGIVPKTGAKTDRRRLISHLVTSPTRSLPSSLGSHATMHPSLSRHLPLPAMAGGTPEQWY